MLVNSERGVYALAPLDFSRCRLTPFAHQREDTLTLIRHPFFFLANEMRTGKSKIVIDAAQFLFERGTISRIIIVAPAPVRDVWFDPTLGEIAKHLWEGLYAKIYEYHGRSRSWVNPGEAEKSLDIYVTNYEFIRSKIRLKMLLSASGPKTLLILDESSFVKNYKSQQTKACLQLRRACGRVVLLNGTPIFHSPLDLFSQGNILHPTVLDCKYITHFKARYAIQQPVLGHGGKPLSNKFGGSIQKITGWRDLEDIQRRFAPHTVRRLQKDCLDLPPKLDSVILTFPLDRETWRVYREMRDELVVWLENDQVATSLTAAVKAIRLSQITSGLLGGIEEVLASEISEPTMEPIRPISREKIDGLLWLLESRLESDPNLHIAVWCRFRAELFRVAEAVREKFPQFEIGLVHGGQNSEQRVRSLSLLKPETSPTGPVFVAGIEGTGSFGLDFCAAHTCVTISSGYSPGRSAQTLDRVYGPGQKFPIAYFDVLATGPKGQRTIDHVILEAKKAGKNVAEWTSSAWVKELQREEYGLITGVRSK